MSFKKNNFDLYSTPMTPTPGAKKASDLQNLSTNASEGQSINEKDFNNPLKANSKEFLPQIASMIGRAVHGDLYKSDLLSAFDELIPDPEKEAQKQRKKDNEFQQAESRTNQDEFDFSFLDQSVGQAEVEIEVEFTEVHDVQDLDELAMEPIVFNQDQLAIVEEQHDQDLFDPMKTPEMYSQTKEDLLLNESTIVETSPSQKPIFDDPFADLDNEKDAPRFFYDDELEESLKKKK